MDMGLAEADQMDMGLAEAADQVDMFFAEAAGQMDMGLAKAADQMDMGLAKADELQGVWRDENSQDADDDWGAWQACDAGTNSSDENTTSSASTTWKYHEENDNKWSSKDWTGWKDYKDYTKDYTRHDSNERRSQWSSSD